MADKRKESAMNALSQKRSPSEQLALLDARLGKEVGAKKERARLLKMVSPKNQKNEESKKSRVIFLPDAENMLRRLCSVQNDSNVNHGLYPLILKYASTPKVAAGIVMMLVLTINEYFKKEQFPPIMLNILSNDIPDYINALVDDPEVREEAKAFWKKVLSDAARKA